MAELLSFRKKNTVPPGGYAYQDPDTEYMHMAGDMNSLIKMATDHRKANNLEIPSNLPAIIEDWMCQRIPIDLTSAYNTVSTSTLRSITSTAVTKTTTDYLHAWRRHGRKVVTPLTAAKRAAICATCDENSSHVACLSCKGILAWVKDWITRTTPSDKVLFVCDKCAVLNVAQVHMTKVVLSEMSSDQVLERYPDNCWKKKLLQGTE